MNIPENASHDDLQRLIADQTSRSQGLSPIISESPDSITIRRPMSYPSIHPNTRADERQQHDEQTRAAIQRHKYYSKLAPSATGELMMPNHVVPSSFFLVIPFKSQVQSGNQSSIITIFSIWNTMMGTSLLSMPWAMKEAGFATAMTLILVMSALTLYTAYRVMKSPYRGGVDSSSVLEFTDICCYYFGKPGLYISVFFSLVALLGAAVVYWVLMSNFLYHSVTFVHDKITGQGNQSTPVIIGNRSFGDAICPTDDSGNSSAGLFSFNDFTSDSLMVSDNSSTMSDVLYDDIWDQYKTVPFFLILILFPLSNFKSPTFFTKFNALGTVSVAYIIAFVAYKSSQWGFNVDFKDESSTEYIANFHWTFPAMSGILSLAFFIHNCVLSIVRNQRHPENNGRDLSIAYICVALTYLIIGVLFYVSFPLPKSCIEDNLLNNFRSSDLLSFIARIFLFFQMVTVFPLLMFILRVQFMHTVFGNVYPSIKHVVTLNLFTIGFCIIFAVFLPQIGTIIRFSGALCGMVYIFTLPSLAYLYARRAEGSLNWMTIAIHSLIISVGVANFVGQFLILGKE